MSSVLVTGAAGFIGSHVAHRLLQDGQTVIGFDNLNDYYSLQQKRINLARLTSFPDFHFYQGDLESKTDLESLFQTAPSLEAVIHLAARAGVRPSIADPELYYRTNVLGTLNLLETMRTAQVRNLIAASSSSVYGEGLTAPFSESARTDFPISPYASTKKSMEELCAVYTHLHAMNITCLRFFTVYGPAGRPDMAPYLFTKAILTGTPIKKFGVGNTARDYTYIDDIVSGILAALQKVDGYHIYNLGKGEPITLNEFIHILEEITGQQAVIEQHPAQPGDVSLTYADITAAQRDLNYTPTTHFSEGLKKFVEWYRNQDGA